MIKTPLSTMIGGAFWTPKATILGGTSKTFDQLIKSLFANNEQGFFYDPNDLSTMFQNDRGTVPVTRVGQPVGLMLDKSKGLELGVEQMTNGDFSNGLEGWDNQASSFIRPNGVVDGKVELEVIANGFGIVGIDAVITTTVGGWYAASCDVISRANNPAFLRNETLLLSGTSIYGTGRSVLVFRATTETTAIRCAVSFSNEVVGQKYYFGNVSVKELYGNHAYQTTSSMRPLLVAAPQRLDYDTVDDKLTTSLPAQITGCTVVRAVPNVGTQILTNQTIPTTYNDNTDHCGLIVINRALTPSETAAIEKELAKRVGVTLSV